MSQCAEYSVIHCRQGPAVGKLGMSLPSLLWEFEQTHCGDRLSKHRTALAVCLQGDTLLQGCSAGQLGSSAWRSQKRAEDMCFTHANQ